MTNRTTVTIQYIYVHQECPLLKKVKVIWLHRRLRLSEIGIWWWNEGEMWRRVCTVVRNSSFDERRHVKFPVAVDYSCIRAFTQPSPQLSTSLSPSRWRCSSWRCKTTQCSICSRRNMTLGERHTAFCTLAMWFYSSRWLWSTVHGILYFGRSAMKLPLPRWIALRKKNRFCTVSSRKVSPSFRRSWPQTLTRETVRGT